MGRHSRVLSAFVVVVLLLSACGPTAVESGSAETDDAVWEVADVTVGAAADGSQVITAADPETGEEAGEIRGHYLEWVVTLRNGGSEALSIRDVRLLPTATMRELYEGMDPFEMEAGLRSNYGALPSEMTIEPGATFEVRRSVLTFSEAEPDDVAEDVETYLSPEEAEELQAMGLEAQLEIGPSAGTQVLALDQ